MKKSTLGAAAMIAAMLTTHTFGHGEGDVWIRASSGNLATGLIEENGTPIAPFERVFASELGEDPLFPDAGDEPGFQTEPDDPDFPLGTTVTINVTEPLGVWNGAGFDATGNYLQLEFGTQLVRTDDLLTNDHIDLTAGFDGPSVAIHDHVELTLFDMVGDSPAQGGLYLLSLFLSGDGLGDSDPFYLVINHHADESVHDEAIEWVESNVVPGPAVWAMLIVVPAMRGPRRRR